MISYAIAKVFLPYHVVAWDDARQLVEMVGPIGGRNERIRCHELARAVLHEMSPALVEGRGKLRDAIEVHDGMLGGIEHSWLQFTKTGTVIDVYRPGCHPQVLLLDRMVAVDYKFTGMRTDINLDTVAKLRLMMQG